MKQDTIKHHITDELLMAYSAGNLSEGFSLAIATHISMCDECRARLGAFDSVGGSLMESCDIVEMSDSSLSATFDLIESLGQIDMQAAPEPVDDTVPQPLQSYLGGGLDDVRWRPVGMGVKQAILPTDGDAVARLLYIPAGVAMPDHGHHGTELTLVLQGAFRDEVDRFGPGDIEIADEHLDHTPVAEEGEDCICLAVTDAKLKFNSILPRLAQPFLRI